MTEILTKRGISWRSAAWDKNIAREFVKGLRVNLTQLGSCGESELGV